MEHKAVHFCCWLCFIGGWMAMVSEGFTHWKKTLQRLLPRHLKSATLSFPLELHINI